MAQKKTKDQQRIERWDKWLTETTTGLRVQQVVGVFFGYQVHYIFYPFIGRLSSTFGYFWTFLYVIGWAVVAHLTRAYLQSQMSGFANTFYYSTIGFSILVIVALTLVPQLDIFSSFLGL